MVSGEPKGNTVPERYRHDAVTSRLRLRGYDYASPGAYFVTICTERRVCLFGDVREDQVIFSPAGQVVESWWDSIPQRFPGVMLDERIIMPNHVHGVIEIGACPEAIEGSPLPKLNEIIRWFKSMSTRDYILGVQSGGWPRFPGKLWQERYYDHIVRSDAALERIRAYIEANPSQWHMDEDNPDRSAL